MILTCNSLCKAYGDDIILKDVSFHIEDRQKSAIVGINGAGKTTLLRLIMGIEPADSGAAVFSKGKSIGYLAQNATVLGDSTIYEEVFRSRPDILQMQDKLRKLEDAMSLATGEELSIACDRYDVANHEYDLMGGHSYESEVVGVLKGLGFDDAEYNKRCDTLSGGQKTRLALGKLLLSAPDLLILDEPTNHLDMGSIAWLEAYIAAYRGAVLVVSHDRYFLDRFATQIIEIDRGRCTVYSGSYSDYAMKREALRKAELAAYERNREQIEHEEAVIAKLRSFNREKSIRRAGSREKKLDKMERLEKPTEERTDMRISLTPRLESGRDVLSINGLSKSFGARHLFTDADIDIKRGERVVVIGDNGTGKTTLLKIINGLIPADSGALRLGVNVEIGYFDQEHQVLNPDHTVFEEISDAHPYLTNTQIRNLLAAFLFTGDDVFKRIRDISGGEQGRLSLAKLMLGNANFLVLDEPTNHLDIQSKEVLEDALISYEGTVLAVSHDRYFINRIATRILDLRDGHFTCYLGNYDYYLEHLSERGDTAAAVNTAQNATTSSKEEYERKKQADALIRKKANDLKRLEEQISSLEDDKNNLTKQLEDASVATDPVRLNDISSKLSQIDLELNQLYDEWEALAA